MESEAGHYHLFIGLAETYLGKEKVKKRWAEWLTFEAGLMKNMDVRGDQDTLTTSMGVWEYGSCELE